MPATTIVLEWSSAETGVGPLLQRVVMDVGQIVRIFRLQLELVLLGVGLSRLDLV